MLLVRIYRQIRPLLRYVTAAVCVLAIGVQIDAAQIGLINDFSDGVQGWEGSGLVQVANGGPDGEGDGYLRITADGGFGPGGKIAAYNQSSDVRGDLGALDVIAIDVDMFVDPSSQSDLTMRLVLFGPTNTNNRWTSTDAITV
ncbi:MAG: hypothetical protein KDB23_26705, partial [Planctomycetales bacterium]|nr:hypothetical protein [Planctomycetales bacterium]